ncbi:hypothetical protein B0I37DRAFT_400391 [Chaetomium sp. MPI-CAGE-AT-0009]|nr:hypothetical protein B0I37DRAFT_400391 [Chaetomium sp. MPI-CAGE-AT-0009]
MTWEASHNGGVLSQVSGPGKVSKVIYAVAQPIVFHYYAAGNLPVYYNGLSGEPGYIYNGDDPWAKSNDILPLFLRSIIRCPDLARCVRALQFVTPRKYYSTYRPHHEEPEDDIMPALEKASTDLGLVTFNVFHPGYANWWRSKYIRVTSLDLLSTEDRPFRQHHRGVYTPRDTIA